MRTCTVENCNQRYYGRGLCNKHYLRIRKRGNLDLLIRAAGEGTVSGGYRKFRKNGIQRCEHILLAETVLGRSLGKNEVVHHVDGNKLNNAPSNLVICTRSYHALIHQRMRAIEASGNPNWRKCQICKKYDDPLNLYIGTGITIFHRFCKNERERKRRENARTP